MKKQVLILLACIYSFLPATLLSQTPFNGELWYPYPMPQVQAEKGGKASGKNLPVCFDLPTQTELEFDQLPDSFPGIKLLPGNTGAFPPDKFDLEQQLLPTPENGGPLQLVADPTSFPARMNVKVFFKRAGKNWVCSGSLIDSRHVLTAGHCVFDGGWADSLWVVPAYYVDSQGQEIIPFGASNAVQLLSWTGWTQYSDLEWDMGIVFLDRPVGALTNWFGIGASENKDFYQNNIFHNFSYPAEAPFDGKKMYYRQIPGMSIHYESVYILDPEPHWWDSLYVFHYDYGYGGQSGSGYYINSLNQRYIYAVLSHGDTLPGVPPDSTGIAYIHNSQFDQIIEYRNDNIPSTLDLIALWTRVSNNIAIAGNMLDSFTFKIHNYSYETFNGPLETKVFLSSDSVITVNDPQLTVITSNPSIPVLGTTTVYLPGDQPTIPDSMPPGDYYLGVILDTADTNTGNNSTGIWDVQKIKVLNVLVSPSHLEAQAISDTLSFNIQANTYWFISNDAPWIGISQFDGTGNANIQVVCTPNPSSESREYELLVVGPNGLIRKVLIWQAGVSLDVLPTSLDMDECGGLVSFQVYSNFPWTLDVTGIPSWINVLPHGNQSGELIQLQGAPNGSEMPREAVVYVVSGKVVKPVVVHQAGTPWEMQPDSIEVPACGGPSEFVVSANCPWTLGQPATPWLKVLAYTGQAGETVHLEAEPNNGPLPRQAVISITMGQVTKQLTVYQPGVELSVSPSVLLAQVAGGLTEVAIASNSCWLVESSASWLSINQASGSGNSLLQVVYSPNCGNERQANITLTAKGSSISTTILVTQPGAQMVIEPENILFASGGGAKIANITANQNWTAVPDVSWLTVSPDSGVGNADLVITCQGNPGLFARHAKVLIETICGIEEIDIAQVGMTAFLTVDRDSLEFSYSPDTQSIVITSNVLWSVTKKPAWVEVFPASGLGGPDTVEFICLANLSQPARSGIIELSTIGFHKNIFVFQQSKTFTSIPGQQGPGPFSGDSLITLTSQDRNAAEYSDPNRPSQDSFNLSPDSKTSMTVFPNPFQKSITIDFHIATTQRVHLEIWSLDGRRVASLADGIFLQGKHSINWNTQMLPAGVYSCRLTAGREILIKKLIRVQ